MYYIEQLVMAYGIEQDRIPCAQVLGAYTVRFQRQDRPSFGMKESAFIVCR